MENPVKQASVALAMCMFVTMFAGCTTKSEPTNSQQATSAPKVEEPYTIKWFGPQNPTQPYDPEKDPVKKAVEKALNVKYVTEFTDDQQYRNNLNLRIASGDIPDIISQLEVDDYKKYAPQGLFFDMTDLLNEKDSPNIMKETTKDVFDLLKVKGRIYGLPKNSGPGAGYRFDYLLRKDFLDKVGEKQPKTLDDLYNVLKKVKAAMPDVIPFGAYNAVIGEQKYSNNSFDNIFGAFGVTPGYFYVQNGKFSNYDVSPKMKEALAFLQKMYAEGLIDKEFSTMKEANLKDKANASKIFSFVAYWSTPFNYEKDLQIKLENIPSDKDVSNEPFKYYQVMGSITGSDGKAVTPAPSPIGKVEVINAKTKDPKRLLKIIDQNCIIDNEILAIWGIKDEDYSIENNVLTNLGQKKKDSKTQTFPDGTYRGTERYNLSLNVTGYPRYFEALASRYKLPLETAVKNQYQITDAANYLDSTTKAAKYKELCTLRDTYFTTIIMGDNINKFDEFVTKWKTQGGDTIIKELEDSYNLRMNK